VLPTSWLCDRGTRLCGDGGRKLADRQQRHWKWACECGDLFQFIGAANVFVGRTGPNRNVHRDFLVGKRPNKTNCRDKVRIPADQDEMIASVTVCIIDHRYGDADVRALFLDGLKVSIAGQRAAHVRAFDGLVLKAAELSTDQWQRGKGLKVGGLTLAGYPAEDERCEVPDPNDIISIPQTQAKRLKIQPLVWGVIDGSIEEIKPVDVDDYAIAPLGRGSDFRQK
jgi:hypothetical protein